jgi:peptidoglycan hydrolase-like protein with peptidoglycan-binding domain
MKRISQSFNPKNTRSVKNLHEVLSYLAPDLKFKDERRFDEETEQAIRLLAKPDEPILEGSQLNPALVARINDTLVARKYEDTQHVVELHHNFRVLQKKKLLKLEIAKEEIKGKTIGDTTHASIAAFQKKYKLPQTGRMDAATEEKLESVITSIAGSKPQPKKLLKTRNVPELNRVVRALRLNESGERVQHLQKGLAWMGYKIHDQEYQGRTYGITTKNAIKQFQSDHQLPITGRVDKTTALAINLELGKANPNLLTCEKIRVRGSARDERWQGRGGITVRVYQQGLGGKETLLGERATYPNGFYDVFFTPPYDPYQTPLHLVIKFFDGDQLLKSMAHYNAKKVVWANYTEGEDRYQGMSEFEKLLKTLEQPLKAGGLAIESIEQSDTRLDIAFLFQETGILPETIMKLSLAHRIAQRVGQSDLPPAVFYAYLRQNLPPEMPSDLFPDEPKEWHEWLPRLVDQLTNGLIFMDSEIQQAALDTAFAQNFIPRVLKF